MKGTEASAASPAEEKAPAEERCGLNAAAAVFQPAAARSALNVAAVEFSPSALHASTATVGRRARGGVRGGARGGARYGDRGGALGGARGSARGGARGDMRAGARVAPLGGARGCAPGGAHRGAHGRAASPQEHMSHLSKVCVSLTLQFLPYATPHFPYVPPTFIFAQGVNLGVNLGL